MDDEPLGMDHPLIMARMQATLDGIVLAMEGRSLDGALKRAVPRIRMLFGEDIPRELIEVRVTVGYCSSPHAPIPEQSKGDTDD